ncbi:MAG: hypothetical protein ACI9MB_002815, partial [Verrucomicrobiales bacterium]
MPRFWNRAKFSDETQADAAEKTFSVLGWITLTVVFFHVALWLLSIIVLVTQVGAVESELAEGAMRDHGG